jgi:isopropylmalate/homocitrate/citramalate synthase
MPMPGGALVGAGPATSTPDLWDETLREGAERSPLSPSVAEKCEMACALADAGIGTLVVGMFPDVPHNVELLAALLDRLDDGRLPPATRLVVISHLGITLDQTFTALRGLERDLSSIWILGIHSTSDLQIEHLYPAIRLKDPATDFDETRWSALDPLQRRRESLAWAEEELGRLAGFEGGGVAVGMLDAFRSDPAQLLALAEGARRAGVGHARLVDTAGTCAPQQIDSHVAPLAAAHPQLRLYGHFHNDFGLATANAMLGLCAGLAGVDVSIGGFANRAGHPALAEVVMAGTMLYGMSFPGLAVDRLCTLSRLAEKVYGLMESPAQPITGVITHGVLSGIRTQLIERAPTIFDVIDPESVGAHRARVFGVRSGTDGMRRFLADHAEGLGLEDGEIDGLVEPLFAAVMDRWESKSETCASEISTAIDAYHSLLTETALLTEREMLELVGDHLATTTS